MNSLVHLELHTGNVPEARAFYAALCGWRPATVKTVAGPYVAIELGGEVSGGIVESPSPHPIWLPYVHVESVGTATERARALGARVLIEPREGPAGWRSVVATPTAGELAFWEPKR